MLRCMVDLLKALVTVLVPLVTLVGTLVGIGNRRNRLRKEVAENLELLSAVEKDGQLSALALPSAWLRSRVTTDVARLTGTSLGREKKPLPVGGMIFAGLFALGFGFWTWWLVKDGFVWYSVFPGCLSFLSALSFWGQTLNREIDPNELPIGATRIATASQNEQVASYFALESTGQLDGPMSVEGQAQAVVSFVLAMEEGEYEKGLTFADENWFRCRVQAWVHNNAEVLRAEGLGLEQAVDQIVMRTNLGLWDEFLQTERAQFANAWGGANPLSDAGIARKRRRISDDIDMVVLAPGAAEGGYFVTSAVSIPNAVHFLVRRTESGWLVVNHLGFAPPTPGIPPVWWTPSDATWNELAMEGEDRPATSEASEDTDRSVRGEAAP